MENIGKGCKTFVKSNNKSMFRLNLSHKELRMVIGMGMGYCFLQFAVLLNISIMSGNLLVLFALLLNFGTPIVMYILLSYHVLMKVYKYETN